MKKLARGWTALVRWMNRTISALASIAATLLLGLPLMSTRLVGGESATMTICGYHLAEFSALGWFVIFAPILAAIILLIKQPKIAKTIEISVLLVGYLACYEYSFDAAYTWLYSIEKSSIAYYSGAFFLPLSFVIALLVPSILKLRKKD